MRLRLAATFAAVLLAAGPATTSQSSTTFLRAARLFDST